MDKCVKIGVSQEFVTSHQTTVHIVFLVAPLGKATYALLMSAHCCVQPLCFPGTCWCLCLSRLVLLLLGGGGGQRENHHSWGTHASGDFDKARINWVLNSNDGDHAQTNEEVIGICVAKTPFLKLRMP